MRARHEAIRNDRSTSRCKAGCVAVIGSGIRLTYAADFAGRCHALDRVSMSANFGSTTTGPWQAAMASFR